MKRPSAPSITNLIGILLVIVALVSAGGLYFVASEYSKISETMVVIESRMVDLSVVNSSDEAIIYFTVIVNNTSDLDIDVYRIEYDIHSDDDLSYLFSTQSIILGGLGTGTLASPIDTVESGTTSNEIFLSVPIKDKPYTKFMETVSDGNANIFMDATLFFRISKYPDVIQKVDISEFFRVVVQHG